MRFTVIRRMMKDVITMHLVFRGCTPFKVIKSVIHPVTVFVVTFFSIPVGFFKCKKHKTVAKQRLLNTPNSEAVKDITLPFNWSKNPIGVYSNVAHNPSEIANRVSSFVTWDRLPFFDNNGHPVLLSTYMNLSSPRHL